MENTFFQTNMRFQSWQMWRKIKSTLRINLNMKCFTNSSKQNGFKFPRIWTFKSQNSNYSLLILKKPLNILNLIDLRTTSKWLVLKILLCKIKVSSQYFHLIKSLLRFMKLSLVWFLNTSLKWNFWLIRMYLNQCRKNLKI